MRLNRTDTHTHTHITAELLSLSLSLSHQRFKDIIRVLLLLLLHTNGGHKVRIEVVNFHGKRETSTEALFIIKWGKVCFHHCLL